MSGGTEEALGAAMLCFTSVAGLPQVCCEFGLGLVAAALIGVGWIWCWIWCWVGFGVGLGLVLG